MGILSGITEKEELLSLLPEQQAKIHTTMEWSVQFFEDTKFGQDNKKMPKANMYLFNNLTNNVNFNKTKEKLLMLYEKFYDQQAK